MNMEFQKITLNTIERWATAGQTDFHPIAGVKQHRARKTCRKRLLGSRLLRGGFKDLSTGKVRLAHLTIE